MSNNTAIQRTVTGDHSCSPFYETDSFGTVTTRKFHSGQTSSSTGGNIGNNSIATAAASSKSSKVVSSLMYDYLFNPLLTPWNQATSMSTSTFQTPVCESSYQPTTMAATADTINTTRSSVDQTVDKMYELLYRQTRRLFTNTHYPQHIGSHFECNAFANINQQQASIGTTLGTQSYLMNEVTSSSLLPSGLHEMMQELCNVSPQGQEMENDRIVNRVGSGCHQHRNTPTTSRCTSIPMHQSYNLLYKCLSILMPSLPFSGVVTAMTPTTDITATGNNENEFDHFGDSTTVPIIASSSSAFRLFRSTSSLSNVVSDSITNQPRNKRASIPLLNTPATPNTDLQAVSFPSLLMSPPTQPKLRTIWKKHPFKNVENVNGGCRSFDEPSNDAFFPHNNNVDANKHSCSSMLDHITSFFGAIRLKRKDCKRSRSMSDVAMMSSPNAEQFNQYKLGQVSSCDGNGDIVNGVLQQSAPSTTSLAAIPTRIDDSNSAGEETEYEDAEDDNSGTVCSNWTLVKSLFDGVNSTVKEKAQQKTESTDEKEKNVIKESVAPALTASEATISDPVILQIDRRRKQERKRKNRLRRKNRKNRANNGSIGASSSSASGSCSSSSQTGSSRSSTDVDEEEEKCENCDFKKKTKRIRKRGKKKRSGGCSAQYKRQKGGNLVDFDDDDDDDDLELIFDDRHHSTSDTHSSTSNTITAKRERRLSPGTAASLFGYDDSDSDSDDERKNKEEKDDDYDDFITFYETETEKIPTNVNKTKDAKKENEHIKSSYLFDRGCGLMFKDFVTSTTTKSSSSDSIAASATITKSACDSSALSTTISAVKQSKPSSYCATSIPSCLKSLFNKAPCPLKKAVNSLSSCSATAITTNALNSITESNSSSEDIPDGPMSSSLIATSNAITIKGCGGSPSSMLTIDHAPLSPGSMSPDLSLGVTLSKEDIERNRRMAEADERAHNYGIIAMCEANRKWNEHMADICLACIDKQTEDIEDAHEVSEDTIFYMESDDTHLPLRRRASSLSYHYEPSPPLEHTCGATNDEMRQPTRHRSVHFVTTAPQVHVIDCTEEEREASRECRNNYWEMVRLERLRRNELFESVLNPVLNQQHRERIYKERFQPAQE